MNIRFPFWNLRRLGLAFSVGAGALLGHSAWSKPSIQSVTVAPNPLTIARSFAITVSASPDVNQATAVVDFKKGSPEFIEVPLTKQGSNWVGSGFVPLDLHFDHPRKAEAKVRVLALDVALRKTEETVRVDVVVPDIVATFTNGILTIVGDDQDNTIVASRDFMGQILVNGGGVPIVGGSPTISNTTLIRILGRGGDDTIQISDNTGAMPRSNILGGEGDDFITGGGNVDEIDGGSGNDTLLGRAGADVIFGGPGNDIINGGQNDDFLDGGGGDDQFVWNPGDSNDVIEGRAGDDALVFNGSNIGENIDLSANGSRLRFSRNIANITMDCDGIEQVMFRALGGADQVVVNELTGTQVSQVTIDLFNSIGLGDGLADSVIVNGTGTNDIVAVVGPTNSPSVLGLSAMVTIIGADPDADVLMVNGLAGNDVIDASGLDAGAVQLNLFGGIGKDTLIGSNGSDLLNGGREEDSIFGGMGDDIIEWNPGDGSDIIEGQAGFDTLQFNGANVAEIIDISANGSRARLTRNIAAVAMDFNQVESVRVKALGGADNITVNDLSGTGISSVNLDLHASDMTSGDGEADVITIYGSNNDDTMFVMGNGAGVSVQGTAARVNITGNEGSMDQLVVRLLDGDDVATAEGLLAGLIGLTLDAGFGDDVLIGSAGMDMLLGGDGDDVLIGGPGLDILDGGAGDNILVQD